VLREIVAGEIPAVVSPHTELYAVPALAGAMTVVLAGRLAITSRPSRRAWRRGEREAG
jgi:uncharacterized membrane protein YeiH